MVVWRYGADGRPGTVVDRGLALRVGSKAEVPADVLCELRIDFEMAGGESGASYRQRPEWVELGPAGVSRPLAEELVATLA